MHNIQFCGNGNKIAAENRLQLKGSDGVYFRIKVKWD